MDFLAHVVSRLVDELLHVVTRIILNRRVEQLLEGFVRVVEVFVLGVVLNCVVVGICERRVLMFIDTKLAACLGGILWDSVNCMLMLLLWVIVIFTHGVFDSVRD